MQTAGVARPIRIAFPGAHYHVTARGDRREPIFVDNLDRNALLDVLARGLERFDATLLAYCLMGNHYHLVVHTRQANLSQLMRHVNGVYTQRFNRRHGLVGHLFQGRYNAFVVDQQNYLMEVCRYVDLNPVRAGMVAHPGDWPWSSYAAHTGRFVGPAWLDSLSLWAALLGVAVASPAQVQRAAHRYADLVQAAPDARLWDAGMGGQAVLGSSAFAAELQTRMQTQAQALSDQPKASGATGAAPAATSSLQDWLQSCSSREEAFWHACRRSGYTMTRIGKETGLSVQHVSRLIARWEQQGGAQVKGET